MSAAAVVSSVLLAAAVALVFACAAGVLVMRDGLQRLHYVTPAATVAPFFVALALAVDDHQASVWTKASFVVVLLFATNAVISHATARAMIVRQHQAWPPPRESARGAPSREGAP